MRLPARPQSTAVLPGLVGVARVERRARLLLPRLRPGDVAVLDHPALDRSTARGLVDAGVAAVVNASPMVSGRYPNLGPQVLAAAGVPMVDGVGADGLAAIPDGATVRLHDGRVHVGERVLAGGRPLDPETLSVELEDARRGLVTQLETFTHGTTELLRREQDLLLHGQGLPPLRTSMTGRTVVVVVAGHDHERELGVIRPYLREQQPVVVAVGRAADTLRAAGRGTSRRADVVVVDAAEPEDQPSARTLKAAADVVVRVDRGSSGKDLLDSLDRLGVRPLLVRTDAAAEDTALLLAHAGEASVVIGVGMHATLEEFLDRRRSGLASTYLTRLKVGPRLVDAAAVPYLYSGRVRPSHLLAVMLSGLVALAAAVGITPVGQEWAGQLSETLQGLLP